MTDDNDLVTAERLEAAGFQPVKRNGRPNDRWGPPPLIVYELAPAPGVRARIIWNRHFSFWELSAIRSHPGAFNDMVELSIATMGQLRAACRLLGIELREPPADNPTSPAHYKGEGGRQCIDDIFEAMPLIGFHGFCVGNAMKYRDRQGRKPGAPAAVDLAKAEVYDNWAAWAAEGAQGERPWREAKA